jgi:hypothetical protein
MELNDNIDDIDDLVCEVNLYVVKYIIYENMIPMTFIANKNYESLKDTQINIFEKVFKKTREIYWKFTDNQIDNLIIKCNKIWKNMFNITKINEFAFIIDK